MRYEIMQPGAFAFLKVQLEAGESIKAESDAMRCQVISKLKVKWRAGYWAAWHVNF